MWEKFFPISRKIGLFNFNMSSIRFGTNALQGDVMNLEEKMKYIAEQIEGKLEVAIQQEGYHQEENLEDVFDDYRGSNGLSSFNDIKEQLRLNKGVAEFDYIIDQFKEVDDLVKKYASDLAVNAEKNNVKPDKVSPRIYEKFARAFEKRYKEKLVFTSPNSWLY